MVTYITVLAITMIIIQLYYWYYFFNGISKLKAKDSSKIETKPVSVVICARNAEKELEQNIPVILRQNYPDYEVLIIDDDSEDNTASLLKRMQEKERYLNNYKIIKNKTGKKEALSTGIVKSRHSWLLLTDADCTPVSDDWINEMYHKAKSSKAMIVLGYSPYINSGSFLHHWMHFEGWITGLQFLSYAHRGIPYMGLGRNILYHKSVLPKGVIQKHDDLSSGDDDLTVNQIATKDNCTIQVSEKSFVYTTPMQNWSSYFRQKRRHFSTAHRYKFLHKLLLGLYSSSQICFYILLLLICIKHQYLLALTLYLARLLLLLPAVVLLMKKLKATFKLWMFPMLDLGQSLFYVIFSFSVFLPQKNKW